MIRFETEQTIERPADDVWAYAADIRRHPEWMGVTDATIVQRRGRFGRLTFESYQGLLPA
ncbi:MAG TPA: SRPBCC family protein [Candidatus Limnocylindrales bacterium]|nr:SRPBCC family protein [Candidatus Limnocylindrales bacterium]